MHMRGPWDTPNTGSEPGKARWLAKSFPGCPVVKTRVFTAMGPGSIPGQTTKIPQAKQWGPKKKRQQKRVPTETQKKYPIKVIWTATRVWLSLSPPLCLCTCTLFPPNKHLTCFTTFCLYVEIHFCTAEGPGPCHRPLVPSGLVARIQCSHCPGLTSVSGLELKSIFKPLQAKCPGDDDVKCLVPQ